MEEKKEVAMERWFFLVFGTIVLIGALVGAGMVPHNLWTGLAGIGLGWLAAALLLSINRLKRKSSEEEEEAETVWPKITIDPSDKSVMVRLGESLASLIPLERERDCLRFRLRLFSGQHAAEVDLAYGGDETSSSEEVDDDSS